MDAPEERLFRDGARRSALQDLVSAQCLAQHFDPYLYFGCLFELKMLLLSSNLKWLLVASLLAPGSASVGYSLQIDECVNSHVSA